MKKTLIRNSAIAGLILMLLNALLMAVKLVGLLPATAIFLPGFIYGIVVAVAAEQGLPVNKLIFTASSGGLYVLCTWLGTSSIPNSQTVIAIPVAGMLGAAGIILLVHFLLNKSSRLGRSMLLALPAGLLSSLPTAFIYPKLDTFDLPFGEAFLYSIVVFSIFPLWQTGVSLVLSEGRVQAAPT